MLKILLATSIFLAGCASSLPDKPENKSYFYTSNEGALATRINKQTKNRLNETGVYPLGAGTDAFLARISLIQSASTSIDMQYYIYHEDVTGKVMNANLYDAAIRGVKIRMLLDDLSIKDKDDFLKYLNSFPNVEVRLFNPSPARSFKNLGFMFNFSRLNHRMHNKSITIDGQISIIGGRNVGDEYFGASHALDFGDFDLMMIGDAVKQVGTQFDRYWNSDFSYAMEDLHPKFKKSDFKKNEWDKELEKLKLTRTDYQKDIQKTETQRFVNGDTVPWHWGKGKLYYDDPNKVIDGKAETLLDGLRSELEKAKSELVIVSPYFIPGDKGSEKLIALSKKGVRVVIITNSLASTDVVPVYSGFAPYRKRLLDAGVEIFEVKVHPDQKPKSFTGSSDSSLHAKTIMIDRKNIFVGSLNLDPRSVDLNTEVGILFENPIFTRQVYANIMEKLTVNAFRLSLDNDKIVWKDIKKAKTLDSHPNASVFRRMGAFMFRVLPLESQL